MPRLSTRHWAIFLQCVLLLSPSLLPGPASAGSTLVHSYTDFKNGTANDTLAEPAGLLLNRTTLPDDWNCLGNVFSPPAVCSPAFGYDTKNGTFVLVGRSENPPQTRSYEAWRYDSNADVWKRLNLTNLMPAAFTYGGVYDSSSGTMIVLSGDATKTYKFSFGRDNTTWSQVNLASAPAARTGYCLAFDDSGGKMYLFGGVSGANYPTDTWIYAAAAGSWSNPSTSSSPPGRVDARMAYDTVNKAVVLFGGSYMNQGQRALLNDTWVFDTNQNTWTNKSPAVSPSARELFGMAYDPKMGETVINGGVIDTKQQYGNDTWSYDLAQNQWSDRTTSETPPPRCHQAMAYDPQNGIDVMVGGLSPPDFNWRADSWSFNGNSKKWSMGSKNAPSWRTGAQYAYDKGNDQLYIYGGYDGAYVLGVANSKFFCGDTWRYTVRNATWELLCPKKACQKIEPRAGMRTSMSVEGSGSTMVYDRQAGQLLLFGPTAGSWEIPQNMTFVFDISSASWTDLKAGGIPNSIGGAYSMAVNTTSGDILLFESKGGLVSTLYKYNRAGNVWTPMPADKQATFDDVAMVYLESSRKLLLYGRNTNGVVTWIYDFTNGTWELPLNPKNPPGRTQFAMVYASFRDEVVLSGGYSQAVSNVLGDTWCYNVSGERWTQLDPKHPYPAMEFPTSFYYGPQNEVLMLGGSDRNMDSFPFLWSFDRRTYRLEGNFTSSKNDTGNHSYYGHISWNASLPANTGLKVLVRHANDNATLDKTEFTGSDGRNNTSYKNGDAIFNNTNESRFIQYMIFMNSSSEWCTPLLQSLCITYNRRHEVNITDPNSKSIWTGQNAIRWTINDTDNDTYNSTIDLLDADKTFKKSIWSGNKTKVFYWDTSDESEGTYIIRLTVRDENSEIPLCVTAFSEVFMIQHPNGPPTVTLLSPETFSIVNSNEVTLEWNGADPENDTLTYRVYWDTFEIFPDSLPESYNITNDTSYTVTGLLNDTWYYWTVIANDSRQDSTFMDNWLFKLIFIDDDGKNRLPLVTLIAPNDGETVTNDSVRLSWSGSDPDSNRLTYFVFLAQSAFNFSSLPAPFATTNDTFYNLTGLENGTTYYWTVIANDSRDNGTMPELWSFSVPLPIDENTPHVIDWSPKGNGTQPNTAIQVTFDREMNYQSVVFALSGTPELPINNCTPSGNKFIYTLNGPLLVGTTYHLTVGTVARSSQGKNMVQPFNWNFTTLEEDDIDDQLPTILGTIPLQESKIDSAESIIIMFSEMMDLNATKAACSLAPSIRGSWEWLNNRGITIKFTPASSLANGKYYVSISSEARDPSGNRLDGFDLDTDGIPSNVTFNFTIGTGNEVNPRLLTKSWEGKDIRPNAVMTIAFDRQMNLTSIIEAFSIYPWVDGCWTSDAEGKVFNFTPKKQLRAGTTYSVTLTTAARDVFGNRLKKDEPWSFKTVMPHDDDHIGPEWWILLALVMALAAGTAAVAVTRRRKAAAAAAAAAPKGFAIEDVFLMYNDGRLIQHTTRRIKADMDVDIFTSMLAALQGFVKESVGRDTGDELGSMEFGGNKILLEKGKHVIVAVVITGGEPAGFRDEMKAAVRNIESEHGAVLADWDGSTSRLAGAQKFLSELGGYRAAEEPAAAAPRADVTLKSELEFYQGFVRLKVAVKNRMATMIAKATFKLIYNDSMLRLDHIEPPLESRGDEVVLGIIEPDEKKTVAFYLDPQICTESHIEGVLTFKDARGNLETVKMPRKLAAVVCPVLFTDENINTAMLKRMAAEELDKKDSKVFTIPSTMAAEKAYEIGKAAVQHHDLRLVREFREERPFRAEAWYFGKAKGRPDRLVVRVRVIPEMTFMEFSVSSDSVLMLTGMLAELRTDLNKELDTHKLKGAMKQVTDRDDIDAVAEIRLLLEKADAAGSG